jgi:hypothetical protein
VDECKPLPPAPATEEGRADRPPGPPSPRVLHSSTFQLNVSTFGGIRWVISVTERLSQSRKMDECFSDKTAQVEPTSGRVFQ